jgi:hypothetical protein
MIASGGAAASDEAFTEGSAGGCSSCTTPGVCVVGTCFPDSVWSRPGLERVKKEANGGDERGRTLFGPGVGPAAAGELGSLMREAASRVLVTISGGDVSLGDGVIIDEIASVAAAVSSVNGPTVAPKVLLPTTEGESQVLVFTAAVGVSGVVWMLLGSDPEIILVRVKGATVPGTTSVVVKSTKDTGQESDVLSSLISVVVFDD